MATGPNDASVVSTDASPDDLVAVIDALVESTPSAATEHFDHLVWKLVAAGRLDASAAQELRWWQRQTVRAVADHLGNTAPVTIRSVVSSRSVVADAIAAAARAWDDAVRAMPDPDPTPPDRPSTGTPVDVRDPVPPTSPFASTTASGTPAVTRTTLSPVPDPPSSAGPDGPSGTWGREDIDIDVREDVGSEEPATQTTGTGESEVIDLRRATRDTSAAHEWAGVAYPARHPQSLRSPQRRLLITGLSVVPGRPTGKPPA